MQNAPDVIYEQAPNYIMSLVIHKPWQKWTALNRQLKIETAKRSIQDNRNQGAKFTLTTRNPPRSLFHRWLLKWCYIWHIPLWIHRPNEYWSAVAWIKTGFPTCKNKCFCEKPNVAFGRLRIVPLRGITFTFWKFLPAAWNLQCSWWSRSHVATADISIIVISLFIAIQHA
jgi:hypothetical protein